ncbi:MAG: ankyrin repeat domain-containing protein [bacterium]
MKKLCLSVLLLILGTSAFAQVQNDIFSAAKAGDAAKVAAFIASGVDINGKDATGWTILMYAAKGNKLTVIEKIIELKTTLTTVDAKNKSGTTALMMAAINDKTVVITKLLDDLDAKIDEIDNGGKTALIWAASLGKIKAVTTLVELGADRTIKDKNLKTAAMIAKDKGYSEIVAVLESKTKKEQAEDNLFYSAKMGSNTDKIADYVKKDGANVNAVDTAGKTPLIWAVVHGNTTAVSILVYDLDADMTIKDLYNKTAVDYATDPWIKEILEAKKNNTVDDKTKLFEAAKTGDLLTIKELFNKHSMAYITGTKNTDDMTALMYAAEKGQTEMVIELVNTYKANINAGDIYNMTPLMVAAYAGKAETIDTMVSDLKAQLELKTVGNITYTALLWAASVGKVESIDKLVELGANINAVGPDGETALMLVAKQGLTDEVVKMLDGSLHKKTSTGTLVEVKADATVKDKNGKTVMDYAIDAGHLDIKDKLIVLGVQ